MVSYNKTYVETILMKLLKHNWESKPENVHKFSQFFSEASTLFDPELRKEYNQRIRDLELKYGDPLFLLETAIPIMIGTRSKRILKIDKREVKRSPTFDFDYTIDKSILDTAALQRDLNRLVHETKMRLHKVAADMDIDFKRTQVLEKKGFLT